MSAEDARIKLLVEQVLNETAGKFVFRLILSILAGSAIIASSAFYVGIEMSHFKYALDTLANSSVREDVRLTRLEAMSIRASTRWTYSMMRTYTDSLKVSNPMLFIPNVTEIHDTHLQEITP